MQIKQILTTLATGIIFCVIVGSGTGLMAASPTATPSTTATSSTNRTQKLADAKLKVCQTKQVAIAQRSKQLTKMAENMLIKFDQTTTKVEQYYTTKVVPTGQAVTNYATLVAEIATKKQSVQTSLNQANTDSADFDCSGSNPKGQLTQFRTDMITVKKNLKDYRTAIKNLIVAIHSVTGTTQRSVSPSAIQ